MEIDYTDNSNWLFDYGLVQGLSTVVAADFHSPLQPTIAFGWPSDPLNSSSNVSADIDCSSFMDSEVPKETGSRKRADIDCSSFMDSEVPKETGSRKRMKSESCNTSGSKACREKLRRDKLNERFLELCSVLEPGRPPKTDKVAILSDAVRMVTQLRTESQKLMESNNDLHEKIKELKVEKNELRDEKQRLKVERDKLEMQVKAMSSQQAGFTAGANKLMPFVGYPSVAMWQFMPPAVVDTSQDHVLRPPVA